jgi:hypothetical protein
VTHVEFRSTAAGIASDSIAPGIVGAIRGGVVKQSRMSAAVTGVGFTVAAAIILTISMGALHVIGWAIAGAILFLAVGILHRVVTAQVCACRAKFSKW